MCDGKSTFVTIKQRATLCGRMKVLLVRFTPGFGFRRLRKRECFFLTPAKVLLVGVWREEELDGDRESISTNRCGGDAPSFIIGMCLW